LLRTTCSLAIAAGALIAHAPAQAAFFDGDLSVAKWTLSNDPADGDGFVDTTHAPSFVDLYGSDNGTTIGPIPVATSFAITITSDRTLSFDWRYFNGDVDGAAYDPFGYTVESIFTQLTDDAGAQFQQGALSIPLTAGQTFAFNILATDNQFGRGHVQVGDNLTLTPIPAGAALLAPALVGFGTLAWRRRRA
jgi:hypothetical protein